MNRNNLILIIVAVAALAVALVVLLTGSPERDGAVDDLTSISSTPTPAVTPPPRPRAPSGTSGHGDSSLDAMTMPAQPATDDRPSTYSEKMALLRLDIFGDDAEARENALNELAALLVQDQGQEVLMDLLKSDNEGLVREGLILIPNLEETQRMPFLFEATDNPNPELRNEGYMLLHDIALLNPDAILTKGLNDTAPEVTETVGNLLLYFSDKPIYSAATAGLSHSDPDVREKTMIYLQGRYSVDTPPVLIEALNSEYPDVRDGAAESLSFMLNPEMQTTDYNTWLTWWEQNKEEWAEMQAVHDWEANLNFEPEVIDVEDFVTPTP